MEFAPIVPIRYLNKLAGLSHYHLVLAHWLVDKNYFNFYKKMGDRGDFIILDNGCAELTRAISIDELMDWYKALGGANILVLPDTEHGDNVELAHESWIKYVARLKGLSSKEKLTYARTEFMVVPHTIAELDRFMRYEIKFFQYIGLNRAMEEDFGRDYVISRYPNPGVKFHLLGFYRNPKVEVEKVRKFNNLIIGIDSSVPYSIVAGGRRIEEYRPYPTHLNLNDKPNLDKELLKHCKSELTWFINWVRETEEV